jgi:hypothetical protein
VEKTTKKKKLIRLLLAEKPKGNPPLSKENLTKRDIEMYLHPYFIRLLLSIEEKPRKSLYIVVLVFLPLPRL